MEKIHENMYVYIFCFSAHSPPPPPPPPPPLYHSRSLLGEQGISIKLIFILLPPLQSNRITVLEGLDELVNLEELYISDNGIDEIRGLDNLVG